MQRANARDLDEVSSSLAKMRNLMSQLNSISDNNQDHGPYKWRNGQNVTYKYWAARGNNPANTAHKQDCAYVVSSKYSVDFSLTVKAATLIFISGRGLAISSAKEGK